MFVSRELRYFNCNFKKAKRKNNCCSGFLSAYAHRWRFFQSRNSNSIRFFCARDCECSFRIKMTPSYSRSNNLSRGFFSRNVRRKPELGRYEADYENEARIIFRSDIRLYSNCCVGKLTKKIKNATFTQIITLVIYFWTT